MTASNSYLKLLSELPVISGVNFDTPTAHPLEPVSRVIDRLVTYNVGAVIVIDDNKPIGIITEKDIIERVFRYQLDVEEIRVKEIMSEPLITIESNRTVKEATDLLRTHNIRRLAVTRDGSLIGLTTERRLLNVINNSYRDRSRRGTAGVIQTSIDKPIIAYLSTYPPRECGIATFTYDLVDAITSLQALAPPIITAINDKGGYYDYPSEVKFQVNKEEPETYLDVAEKINNSNIDALNIQHEYGLFGGNWGDNLIEFMTEVKKPIFTTLHTILENPPTYAGEVMRDILHYSERIIVLARVGSRILEQIYDTLSDKVR